MKLNQQTIDILKNFSVINSNLVIKPGNKITTISAAKDILAEYVGEDSFEKKVAIFNLNELLGVISAFKDPEVDLSDNYLTVKEDKQKVKYIYSEESLLTTPIKEIKMPETDILFNLSGEHLLRIQKMAGILSVEDLSFIGDKKKIVARVHDAKNPSGNSFDIDLDIQTKDKFNVHFKVDRINKLYNGDYEVHLSKQKIGMFIHKSLELKYYIAIEATSSFE